uniref:Uncharacterized protein n=1 Tax=Anguilla anguilla TaxID=7936 RepID=A0A0E9WJZ9_ANGAN
MTPYDESDFNLQMSFAFCGLHSVHEILGFFPHLKSIKCYVVTWFYSITTSLALYVVNTI